MVPALVIGIAHAAPKGEVVSGKIAISNMTTIPHSYGNTLDVIGILTNKGDITTSYLRVIVEIYNSSNQLVGLSEGYPSISVLNPGKSTPFSVPTNVSLPAFDHYKVRVGNITDGTT